MQHAQRQYTLKQYFDLQQVTDVKLEYYDGEIYAMAGGSLRHNLLSGNVLGILRDQLRGSDCTPLGPDMRIATPSGLYTYADASVICEKTRDQTSDTIDNPVVLVEVLSDSTRNYDRGRKFDLYRSIPTLRHYILIEQSSVDVEHRQLGPDGTWATTRYTANGVLDLPDIGAKLSPAEIYEGVAIA